MKTYTSQEVVNLLIRQTFVLKMQRDVENAIKSLKEITHNPAFNAEIRDKMNEALTLLEKKSDKLLKETTFYNLLK